jgi:hypothetical protein
MAETWQCSLKRSIWMNLVSQLNAAMLIDGTSAKSSHRMVKVTIVMEIVMKTILDWVLVVIPTAGQFYLVQRLR